VSRFDLEPLRPPLTHRVEYHPQFLAHGCQLVTESSTGFGRLADQHPGSFEGFESVAEQRGGNPGRTLTNLAERVAPIQQVSDDDRRPPFGQHLGTASDRAVLAVFAHVTSLTLAFAVRNFIF